MALILEPKLLIADEPTTALDVTTQKQILALIRELQDRHQTAVLFITHDFGVVAEIADRIVVMNRGDLTETGTRDEILARPSQNYTRRLVSSVPSLVPTQREAPGGEPVLRITGLGRTYAERRSLFGATRTVVAASEVDLTLRRGEILGIVGESGSGKSTVARCIVRLIEPSAGRMLLGETDIARLSGAGLRPLRRKVQIVFQDPTARSTRAARWASPSSRACSTSACRARPGHGPRSAGGRRSRFGAGCIGAGASAGADRAGARTYRRERAVHHA